MILAEITSEQIGISGQVAYWWLLLVIAVFTVLNFLKPKPALHKQFADKEETEKQLNALQSMIKDLAEAAKASNTEQYNARRRMHKKINAQAAALHYHAGLMAGQGRVGDSIRLREILAKAETEEDDGE